MSHQHGGESAIQPERLDQALHLQPRQRIQCAQPFVEQQQMGRPDQRARQGNALALPARKFVRPFIGTESGIGGFRCSFSLWLPGEGLRLPFGAPAFPRTAP